MFLISHYSAAANFAFGAGTNFAFVKAAPTAPVTKVEETHSAMAFKKSGYRTVCDSTCAVLPHGIGEKSNEQTVQHSWHKALKNGQDRTDSKQCRSQYAAAKAL